MKPAKRGERRRVDLRRLDGVTVAPLREERGRRRVVRIWRHGTGARAVFRVGRAAYASSRAVRAVCKVMWLCGGHGLFSVAWSFGAAARGLQRRYSPRERKPLELRIAGALGCFVAFVVQRNLLGLPSVQETHRNAHTARRARLHERTRTAQTD